GLVKSCQHVTMPMRYHLCTGITGTNFLAANQQWDVNFFRGHRREFLLDRMPLWGARRIRAHRIIDGLWNPRKSVHSVLLAAKNQYSRCAACYLATLGSAPLVFRILALQFRFDTRVMFAPEAGKVTGDLNRTHAGCKNMDIERNTAHRDQRNL